MKKSESKVSMEEIVSAYQGLNHNSHYFDALREAQDYKDISESGHDFRRINNMERPPNVLTVKKTRQVARGRLL